MVNQYCAHSFARNWQLPFLNQRKGENDRRKYFRSISTKECCRPRRGLNPRPPGLQSDGASEPPRPAGTIVWSGICCLLQIRGDIHIIFFTYFSTKTYIVGIHPQYMFLWRNWKNSNTSQLIKNGLTLELWCYIKYPKLLGPVVQSVVSLTSSLRVISLIVLADSIYNILIFFAEKMWVAFAVQKLLTFFQQKISAYLRITRCKF